MIPSPLLVVTDRHGSARPLVDTVRGVLDGGARWIWFRDKDLEPAARRDLAAELLALVRAAGGRLTIGGDMVLAAEIAADGAHLGMSDLDDMPSPVEGHGRRISPRPLGEGDRAQRGGVGNADAQSGNAAAPSVRFAATSPRGGGEAPPEPHDLTGSGISPIRSPRLERPARDREPLLIGVSAHGLGDVRRAAWAGAGYVTLSPIFSTASKPGYGPALGLDALREAAAIGLPVMALGGIAPEQASVCREAGAAGVAVMGAIMRAPDPAGATRRFLKDLQPLA